MPASAAYPASQAASAASKAIVQAADWMTPGSFTFELVKGAPTALVALVIGLIAAGIAYRQAQIAHAKLKLNLLQRRYDLYMLLREYLAQGTEVPPPNDGPRVRHFQELHAKFQEAIPQAHFLFGREIGEFFELTSKQVRNHNFTLKRLHEMAADAVNRRETEEALLSLSQRTNDERTGLLDRFSSHLSFERWRG